MPNSVIIGSGHYLPERIIDRNFFYDTQFYDDNSLPIEKPVEEIVRKFIEITEIETRHYVDDKMLNTDMGKIAAEKAIADAGIDKETIDYILYAHNFGDVDMYNSTELMPSLSARVKHKLGIKNRKCINYDMIFGCPGWVECLILADNLIKAGRANTVLAAGVDTLWRVSDPYDRDKMIFADGAGAVVLKAADENAGIIAHATYCDNGEEIHYLKNGVSLNKNYEPQKKWIRMQGRKIYEYVLKNVPSAMKETIDMAGLDISDIKKILIHQANAKMDYAVINRLFRLYNIKEYNENISPMTIQQFGNSSVATLPTMYDMMMKKQLGPQVFTAGTHILFASVGAGMNINCIVYKLPENI